MLASLYPLLRPVMFSMDPENAHDFALSMMGKLQRSPFRWLLDEGQITDPYEILGLTFPNRVGLAAGLDKNGAYIDALAALGFGFIEVGTVTPRPQPGNEKPRMFRLTKSEAIINRMGFNNLGVDHLVEKVKNAKFNGVLGINIGKNKDTPEERAIDDYLIGMDKVYPHADYITVNISSPNTPGLRDLQYGDALDELLMSVKRKQAELTKRHDKQVPVLVKIAPDLDDSDIEQLADAFLRNNTDGVIATNTTLSRDSVTGQLHADEMGGLSGRVLSDASTQVIKKLNHALKGNVPIIGVGGIYNGESAVRKIEAGASLVQVYSGFIYQGPKLVNQVAHAIREHSS